MNETFEIPVTYKGEELAFSARLLNLGYSYKIQIEVNGVDTLFEPDEEGSYRVIVDPEHLQGKNKIDQELLQAILGTIESVMK